MTQSAFATALLAPDLPAPAELTGPGALPLAGRFDIYRNSVAQGLVQTLEAGFPVLRKLVGPAFFARMALIFLRQHPPRHRIMMLYGAELAEFLAGFAPVADYPYLPDIARLEQALRESYHAADSIALPPGTLTGRPAALWPTTVLRFAPAVRLICSDWPILGIWRFNRDLGPAPAAGAEDVLILRPEFDPQLHPVPAGLTAAILRLMAKDPVSVALGAIPPGHDPMQALRFLDGLGAVTHLETAGTTPSGLPPAHATGSR